MKIGITEYIDCAHHLVGHNKCGLPHGHTYRVDVEIKSDHKRGMVLDFSEFRKQVGAVLAKYDHQDWNSFLETPTVENICELLHTEFSARMRFPITVRVWEGHDKWAEL